jgi:PAS domain S-box-containing protein
MPGKSIRDFLPPDLVPHALETIQHVFDTGESLREEYSAAIPDGMSWHEVSLSAKWGKDQVITGVVGVVLDITERRRAEESVRQSEERFRGILTSLHETTIVMYDRDGKYLDVWMASDLEQRYGITGKSVVGKSIHDLLPQDLQVHALESIQHVFDTGQSIREEYRVPFPNGEFWHDISISPIWGKSGEVTAAVGFVRDITERKRVEEALRESSEKYTSLFDSTPIPTVVLDGDGNIVDINMAHVEHIGGGKATREDYIGKNVLAFPTIVKAGAGELYEKALKGNTVEAMDIYYPTVTRGIGGYFNLKASPVFDQNGEVSYVIATHDETTERRRTEEALRESEQFSRAVIANSPLGISVRNRYGKLLSVNQAWRDFWQIPEETVREYMAADPDELNLDEKDDYLGKYQSDVIKVYREGGLIRVPEICVNDHRSGKTRWVSHIFYAIKDADGQVDRVVILTNDITVRKQAEEELRQSETRFRQLSAATWEGIAIHEDGIILEANDQYFDMFGYKPEELIGRSAVALTLTPDSAEKVQKQFAEKKLGPHTLMGKKKDGTEFPLEVHVKSMEYHGRPARVVAIRDISDHKKAEAALRESEAKFRRITERSFDAILVTDTEGNLSFASPSTKSVLGYDPKGMIGRNVSEFVHNNSLPEFAYGFAENVQGRSVEGMQIAMIGSEGRTVYAEINSTAVVKDGRVIGTQSIVRDISLRRRAEEMLKEAYDEQSRQLRQVAGGLAHDVYNDLFPVAASIHKLKKRMAESDMPEDHRNSKLLNLMDKAVRRAIDLTESVNLYSKLDRSQIEAGTNLASAIDDVVDQNRDLVSDLDIALEILVPESIDVSCPRIQVFHLINNLLLNAVDAVRESETKTIRLSATSDSDRVRIEIEDSGHGIQPEMLSRVFEPFFSTRPKTGTGLGLAIVQRVVDLSGGKIEVESSLDKGTLFTIILPGNVGTQK